MVVLRATVTSQGDGAISILLQSVPGLGVYRIGWQRAAPQQDRWQNVAGPLERVTMLYGHNQSGLFYWLILASISRHQGSA